MQQILNVALLLQTISVTFSELSLERNSGCRFDSVMLYDGSSNISSQLTKVCTVDPGTVTTTGPSMFIVFSSDSDIHDGRFSLSWTFGSQVEQGWCCHKILVVRQYCENFCAYVTGDCCGESVVIVMATQIILWTYSKVQVYLQQI